MAKKKEETQLVVATTRGFYGDLREPGDVFAVKAGEKASWWKPVDDEEDGEDDADGDVTEPDTSSTAKPAAKPAAKSKAKPAAKPAAKVESKAEAEDPKKAGPFADAPEPIRAKHPVNEETGGTKPDWIA